MQRIKVLCLLIVLFLASAVWSGQISTTLAEYMHDLATGENIKAIVMFKHQADIETLNEQLKQERATLGERNRRVLEALHEAASFTQPAMVSYLEELKSQGLIENYRMFWITNMFTVTATKAGIEALANRPELDYLYLDYPIELIEPVKIEESEKPVITSVEIGLERIHAPEAWALGYTGAGRVVSNIDTGVDGNHPAFADRFRGDVDGDGDCDESWFDPNAGSDFPIDQGEHGTHTMGTICGRSPSGDTIGVAIDALWIAASPDFYGSLSRFVSHCLLAFEWIADPDGNPDTQDNPDAVGNSWGLSPFFHGYPHCDQSFWHAIDNVEAAGTAVIFSAGNEGNYDGPNTPNSLRTPADRETTPYNVFSVGSVNGYNANLPISGFSSRGPTYCTPDGTEAFKPEVVAPGESVRSARPGGGYQQMSGTSMASPHVTGSVAVLRQVNPNLSVDEIKEILIATAEDLPFSNPDGEDNSYGHGIINLYEACQMARSGYVMGYVYDEQENPLVGALVLVNGSERSVITNDEGFYQIGLARDTIYQFITTCFGYIPDTADIHVIPEDTVYHDFTLELAPLGVLDGHVTDLDLNPIDGAIVRAANTPLDSVLTDEEGYYIFNEIPCNNTYDMEALAINYGFTEASVFVLSDDTTSQDFALDEMETFELDNGNWVGDGCWECGIPTSGPDSIANGYNVWATVLNGEYPDDADDKLVTTYYTITDSDATFSFWHWYDMQSGSSNAFDGGNIHITTDCGKTWELVIPEGGYPEDEIVGLDGEPGFSGQSSDWEQVVIDLSAYEGQTIKIKFRFGSNHYTTNFGWYVDAVALNGGFINWGHLSPSANITPLSYNVYLDSDADTTLPLSISNSGSGLLEFITDVVIDDSADYGIITDFGGPDEFGYIWMDSNEPDGPSYDWIDISSIGTQISLTDNDIAGPFEIGFDFPFYGNNYNYLWVCSNGFAAVIEPPDPGGYIYYFNEPFPSPPDPGEIPGAAIAPFWDDLNPENEGAVYYWAGTDTFIVSWVDVPHFVGGGGPYTFQMILLAKGDIIFNYADINPPANSNTVGIQNEDGSIGTQVAYNNFYVEDNLAVKIEHPIFWLTVSPQVGILFPDESIDLDIVFNASYLETGTYTGEILLNTNDPENLITNLPCTLNVNTTGIDEDLPLAPTSLSLSQNYPNPFNPVTEISFGLPTSGHTTLEVYDIMGRKVKTLVDGELPAGTHRVVWNSLNDGGKRVASGVYFYKLSHGDKVIARKMVILK
ncbi:MAG: hypothetical protein DRP26_04365 [Candidatus Zixiibacteriota bacterium]|nr:MAG: hypothetical protein DRP26_04365 [candidate division Zixibacteria bacterium]